MPFHTHVIAALGTTAALLVPATAAHAQVDVSNTAGFSNATPQVSLAQSAPFYCGGVSQPACTTGEPVQVRWGTPASGTTRGRLGYTPAAGTDVGSAPFVLGTLVHGNVPTVDGTGITAVDLRIDTTVEDTRGPVSFSEDVTFALHLDETANNSALCPGESNPCPDFISLPDGTVDFAPVTVGDAVYELHILGFRAGIDAPVVDTMVSQENGSSSVQLIGQVERNILPSADAGGDYTGTEGAPVALDGTATDEDGDALTLSWTHDASGNDAGVACAFSDPAIADPTFTCTDDGLYSVTLTADDGKGGVTQETSLVTLANAAPEISAVTTSAGAPVPVGSSVSVTAPYSDAGSNDTHTWSVDWGDGSADTNGTGTVGGSHAYGSAGLYTVTVTVTDDDLGTDTAQSALVVVYDPSAGFVTGGGWIDSPAGAYQPDPTLTGRANFGFVSKYKKGASVPEGQTQFQFHAAGLSFHSTSYEWLVISGSRGQYKGAGTINGAGDYGFMLTAHDGSPDALRVKIWDRSSGAVVYDNQPGDGDDASATDVLEGGSIVIHRR